MEKVKVLKFLDKYNYNYSEKNNTIVVNLELSQQVKIEFNEPNKIVMTDKLVGWNFLTGLVSMSLKNALVYNFIGTLIFGFFCLSIEKINNGANLMVLFLVFITWIVLFTGFYIIKLENFKSQIISWTKE